MCVIVRGSLLGKLAYKFILALISANVFPKKQNAKGDTSNKQ